MAATGVIEAFTLPRHLEASEPPEARGLKRDDVRLLVSHVDTDSIVHSRFSELTRWLAPGDLLVVNTSGTLNAALSASTADGGRFEVHLSTRLPGNVWVVEVRRPGPVASLPYQHTRSGTVFDLDGGGRLIVLAPYPVAGSLDAPSRLWIAALQLSEPVSTYLERHGSPIRYSYVPGSWPDSMYQTVFATEPGSAEMPSAGRPFTPELVTRLVSSGIQIAPLLLHTGVASLEDHEPPYRRILSRVGRDRCARQRDERKRATCDCGRYHGRPRARDRHGSSRHHVTGGGLDGSGDYVGSAAALGDRHDHRLPRAARDPPCDDPASDCRRRWRAILITSRPRLPRSAASRLPVARVRGLTRNHWS